MLTKTLLKYSVRKKRAYPRFIDPKSKALQDEASKFITLYKSCEGKSLSELAEKVSPLMSGPSSIANGFNKLLSDRVTSSLSGKAEDFVSKRWDIVLEAQKLRQERLFDSLEAFYEILEDRLGSKREKLQKKLYEDLPECQLVESFQTIKPDGLIHYYNVSQVQGLLLNTNKLTISVKEKGLSFRRSLFRQVKFHRLLCKIKEDTKENFSFELSGPLSIFSQRQTYGLRFANFFPHILHAPAWKLEAELLLKGNLVVLNLDESSGLKSHYPLKEAYLPKELLSFMESFNKKGSTWQASPASSFLNIGEKSYCFPDIELKKNGKTIFFLELFHRWHHGQFQTRLARLEKSVEVPLLLGICKQIKEKKEIKEALDKSPVKSKVFHFNEFPTGQKLLTYLSEKGF